jgi:peptidoglycan/xylan/chitin deacetylase (PgdA/CDA1 family)
MPAKLIFVWDYDTPIARITATRPYNYRFESCLHEANDVDTILDYARQGGVKMTFAVVGFGAEPSVAPFDVRDKIRKIHADGHEIASHSWKHEWFPHLSPYQIEKSIERSKFILEECLGVKDAVRGFVLPHDRPMSWPRKFSLSLGDRGLYPFYRGGSIGSILDELGRKDYRWCRVTYRPIWRKLIDWDGRDYAARLRRDWQWHKGMVYFTGTYYGFDDPVFPLLDRAIKQSLPIVVVGHPAGLSRKHEENISHFDRLMQRVVALRTKGDLLTPTVSEYINQYVRRGPES